MFWPAYYASLKALRALEGWTLVSVTLPHDRACYYLDFQSPHGELRRLSFLAAFDGSPGVWQPETGTWSETPTE